MIEKIIVATLFAAGSVLAANNVSAADLAVVNASFEDPAGIPGNNVGQVDPPSDWEMFGRVVRFYPEAPIATAYNTFDVLSIPGQGDVVAATQNGANATGSGLYQTLTDTYVEGVEYTFSLWVGGSYESPGGTQTIGFTTGSGATDLSGSLLASSNVTFPDAGNNWVQNVLSYTATAADAGQNIRIILGTTTANGSQTFDLAAVSSDAAVVPEPSTLALLGLGGLIAFCRYRK